MDQSAPVKSVFDPENLHYDLRADQPFCCFNSGDATVIPLTLSVGKGAPLELYDGSDSPVLIGGRLFANTGTPDEPQRGEMIGEYRAASGPFTAHKGQHYARTMMVGVPSGAPEELLLDVDLVKEQHFWGADVGHKPLTLVITKRRMAIRPAQPDPLDMSEALMNLHDARAREARYEAVIFSLLNQLSKRDT